MNLSKEELTDIIKSEIGNTVEEQLCRLARISQVSAACIVLEQMDRTSERDEAARVALLRAMEAFHETTCEPERKLLDDIAERVAAAIEKANAGEEC